MAIGAANDTTKVSVVLPDLLNVGFMKIEPHLHPDWEQVREDTQTSLIK